MADRVIVRVWDKDDPSIYFEYEISQKGYADSMIALKLEKLVKRESTILDS